MCQIKTLSVDKSKCWGKNYKYNKDKLYTKENNVSVLKKRSNLYIKLAGGIFTSKHIAESGHNNKNRAQTNPHKYCSLHERSIFVIYLVYTYFLIGLFSRWFSIASSPSLPIFLTLQSAWRFHRWQHREDSQSHIFC